MVTCSRRRDATVGRLTVRFFNLLLSSHAVPHTPQVSATLALDVNAFFDTQQLFLNNLAYALGILPGRLDVVTVRILWPPLGSSAGHLKRQAGRQPQDVHPRNLEAIKKWNPFVIP